MHTVGEGGKQRLVGQDIDSPAETLGGLADQLDSPFGKGIRPPITGGAQAEQQVNGNVAAPQRFQPEIVGDAIIELTHACLPQAGIKLGLTEEDDLQQLVAIRLQIGKQPDLFQSLGRHGMRLVDQGHDLTAAGVDLEEPFLQRAEQQMAAPLRKRNAQLLGDGEEYFVAREHRIGQIDRLDVVRKLLEQHPAKHRLAATHLAADLDDAFVVSNGVNQGLEGRAALAASKKELGVRRDPKRRLMQAEMLQIHQGSRADDSIRL
ncbi:MAG: hypothetical protein AW10_03027 [Candidatus Accumulibacter appositus]|uniref:Uncharacterized protein n=1 Tax=Candidatus Accumulibacter appositus TaxID=1454003 RepID=A0A011NSV2_9PROT|nr:MAG: hypothetical protein AW10_03027 [Candidatus Accumulibacter appositus]